MKPAVALSLHRAALRDLAARHGVRNPRVFGSVARGADTVSSDLDLLVDHTPSTTLLGLAALQLDAERLLHVRVDVRTPLDLPASIRDQVLREAVPV